MKKISTDNIAEMRTKLSALEPSKPTELTAREVVAALASEMRAALTRGVSPTDMIGALAPLGFDISPSTLASYLRDLDAGAKTKARRQPKKKATGPAHDPATAPGADDGHEEMSAAHTGVHAEETEKPDVSQKAPSQGIQFRNLSEM